MTSFARPSRRSTPATAGPPRRASHPPTQNRSPDVLCYPLPPEANTEWGQLLRIHTLRSRPAYIRLAVARSTTGWPSGNPYSPPPTDADGLGGDVPAATPLSRVVRPRASPCGRSTLDTKAPPPAQQHPSAEPPVRHAAQTITATTNRDALDKPFHMRTPTERQPLPTDATRTDRHLFSDGRGPCPHWAHDAVSARTVRETPGPCGLSSVDEGFCRQHGRGKDDDGRVR